MAKIDPDTLKSLKKTLKRAETATSLVKKPGIKEAQQIQHNENDNSLFREAVKGVRQLTHDKFHHATKKPAARRLKHETHQTTVVHDPLSDQLFIPEVEPGDIIHYRANGIQNRVFKDLRRGAYPISDELDLHGMTQKQAKQALVGFLQDVIQFENCCVRIIHGKGHRSRENKPVLKRHVNHWLREHDRVLAFHTAKPSDGGAGAVYVLLKTQHQKS